jgi:hypothetical protein
MFETPGTPPATVPEQPQASAPINKKQPLLILLFIILVVFVISSVVNAGKKALPAKSQLTARPAVANPQQVNSFETQQEQVAKKDQEERQQRAATAALLAQLQSAEAPGPESPNAPQMTAAQRAALYGTNNPDAPQTTSQLSERQAQAKQAELAREKQHQDSVALGTRMKSRRAIDAVSIQQRHGGHLQFYCTIDKPFRLRCAFEKTEGACRMKLDIPFSHKDPPA